VLEKIGEGGMSTVFLADDEVHGRKAVLKILKVRRKEDEELWQRFFQECAILSAIDHEHVVRIYDQGFGDEMAYIAMEHLGGGSLREVIDKGLSRRQALSLLSQAASGLAAIHSRGIVHRDLKPANILFRADGRPVLVDFGLARDMRVDSTLTVAGQFLATPRYMSPEQCLGRPVDARSDLYSLGAVLYEMITGKKIYDGANSAEVIAMHVNAPPPKLADLLSMHQPLLDRLLAKKPEDRFQSAAEVLAEIGP
jgi:serine/threonine protein kinase